MNIKKLFRKNKPLATSCLVYVACLMRLFSDCEQHHKAHNALQEDKKLAAWARTNGLNRGFAPWNPRRAPQCTNHWAIQQCKSHPSKTALSGHINISLYLPCMQLHSLRM